MNTKTITKRRALTVGSLGVIAIGIAAAASAAGCELAVDFDRTLIDASVAAPDGGADVVQPRADGGDGGSDTGTVDAGPPLLDIQPLAKDFGSVATGQSSGAIVFTVTNLGGGVTGVPAATLSGNDAAMFAISANTCTAALAARATCTMSVTFSPTAGGVKTAFLNVTGAPGGTVSSNLAGLGLAAGPLTVTPTANNYNNVATGASSADFTFTVKNPGAIASGIPAVTLTGADAAQFAISTNNCTAALPATTGSCTVLVKFSPTSVGAKVASLAITATPGGSATAALTGTGVGPAVLSADSPASPKDFLTVVIGGSSAPVTFTVKNTGGAPSSIPAAPAVTGTNSGDFIVSANTCTAALAPNATCTFNVTFSPSAGAAGTRNGSVAVVAATGGTAMWALTGTAANAAVVTISPNTAQVYANDNVGQNNDITFTLTNTAAVPGITSGPPQISFTGTNAAEFSVQSNNCPAAGLAPQATCTFIARLLATSAGAKSATLNVTANPGTASPLTVALSATALGMTIAPATNNFGPVIRNNSGTAFTYIVTNNMTVATGALGVPSLTGPDASDFTIVSNTCATMSLAATTGTCNIMVNFTPALATTLGAKTATINITAAPPGGTATATATGTAI